MLVVFVLQGEEQLNDFKELSCLKGKFCTRSPKTTRCLFCRERNDWLSLGRLRAMLVSSHVMSGRCDDG